MTTTNSTGEFRQSRRRRAPTCGQVGGQRSRLGHRGRKHLSRRLMIGAAALVLVGLAGFAAWRLAFRDTTTPVSAEEVVQEAGERTTSTVPTTAPPTTATPTTGTTAAPATTATPVDGTGFDVGTAPGDPGLYVYATLGFEEIDALGGARHDYPSETFITIQPGRVRQPGPLDRSRRALVRERSVCRRGWIPPRRISVVPRMVRAFGPPGLRL